MEPVGPHGRRFPDPIETGNRAAAIIGGAVIVFAGLFPWLVITSLTGLDSAEDLHLTWYDYIVAFLAYSFLFLPIIVPGAFLIMRGIRGGPFRLKANARQKVRRTGLGAMLLGVALFLAGLAIGEENPAQGALIYLSLNLVMIGAILALIAFAGRPRVTPQVRSVSVADDGAHDRSVGERNDQPDHTDISSIPG